jgi:TRAP-type C4-dicarboxylate transport system substrate-binding protein
LLFAATQDKKKDRIKMKFHKHAVSSLTALAVAVLMAGAASAQEIIKLTAISGLPAASIGTKAVKDVFIPEVDKRLAAGGKYKIIWTQAYGGSVAKQDAMLRAIQDGIGDIGYVNVLFHGDKLPMEQITYVTPFGSRDTPKVMKVLEQMRAQIPEIDKAYHDQGQVYLAGIAIDTYHLETTFPVKSLDDISGRKIGAPGLSANWLTNTGAVPVAGQLSTYYSSMKTGVYDGIIIFESAIAPFKFYEVAPYVAEANIGSMFASALTINKKRWDELPKDVQVAMREAAKIYQDTVSTDYLSAGERSLKAAAAKGAKITELSEDERKRWAKALPNVAKAWAEDLEKKGLPGKNILATYMDLSRKAGIQHVRAWDKD